MPSDAKQFWPQWRGPLATGVAPNADPPLEWSETKNVKWKAKLPVSATRHPSFGVTAFFVRRCDSYG